MPTCFGKLICAHRPKGIGKRVEPTYFGRAVYAQRPEGIGKQEVPTCFGRAIYAHRPEEIGKRVVPTYFCAFIYAHKSKMDYYIDREVCVFENNKQYWYPWACIKRAYINNLNYSGTPWLLSSVHIFKYKLVLEPLQDFERAYI